MDTDTIGPSTPMPYKPKEDAMALAILDPWILVEVQGQRVLFGYAIEHDQTGGKAWMHSSVVVSLNTDTTPAKATTSSGRTYELRNQKADLAQIADEEAEAAFHVLIENPRGGNRYYARAVIWLQALKIGRWLGVECPPRHDWYSLEHFLEIHGADYTSARLDFFQRQSAGG